MQLGLKPWCPGRLANRKLLRRATASRLQHASLRNSGESQYSVRYFSGLVTWQNHWLKSQRGPQSTDYKWLDKSLLIHKQVLRYALAGRTRFVFPWNPLWCTTSRTSPATLRLFTNSKKVKILRKVMSTTGPATTTMHHILELAMRAYSFGAVLLLGNFTLPPAPPAPVTLKMLSNIYFSQSMWFVLVSILLYILSKRSSPFSFIRVSSCLHN